MSDQSLPPQMLRVYVEDEGQTTSILAAEHLTRYTWVGNWLAQNGIAAGSRVLDLATGSGYGADMLRRVGFNVVGLDADPNAIAFASKAYGGDYRLGDATRMPFEDGAFDAVISFELIEHLVLPNRMVNEVFRVLRADGLYVLSTPNVLTYRMRGINRDHVTEYTPEAIYTLLRSERFDRIRFFGVDSDLQVVRKLYGAPIGRWLLKLKRAVGINRPLTRGRAKHMMEMAISGATSKGVGADAYSVTEDRFDAQDMVFVASKPAQRG